MAVPGRSLSAAAFAALALTLGASVEGISGETEMRVRELIALRPTHGTYTLVGFISKSYHCPPCPPGAECKPCMGANVVLSDSRKHMDSYSELAAGDVIVLTTDAQASTLVVGKRYRLHVEVGTTRFTSQTLNDLRLLGAEPVS